MLLETDDVYSAALPVRTRNVYVESRSSPRIDAVVASGGRHGDPILALSTIDIRGSGLGDVTTTCGSTVTTSPPHPRPTRR